MDYDNATPEQLKAELSSVLRALRDAVETETMPVCIERQNAAYWLDRHQALVPDESRFTVSTSRGRSWRAFVA